MRFEQISDFLEHVRTFHGRVAARYEEMAGETKNERLKMLLYYMVGREKETAESVMHFMEESPRQIMRAWAQPGEHEETLKELLQRPVPDDPDVDGLVEFAMQLAGEFEALFEYAADTADEDDVAAVFRSLLAETRKSREQLARNANMIIDF